MSWILGISSVSLAQPDIPPCVNPEMLPEQAKVPCGSILGFEEGFSPSERVDIARRNGASVRFNYRNINATAVTVPDMSTLQNLWQDSDIKQIIPDRPVEVFKKPDNPGNGGNGGGGSDGQVTPSGVTRTGAAPGVLPVTGANIGIAIVDTGIDLTNSDLNVSPNCFTAYSSCEDDHGHGTHVSGTAAAKNNDHGVVGMAPNATVYAVKVLDNRGSGSDSTIMAGLDWIANNAEIVSPHIKIANLSLGRDGTLNDNPLMREMFRVLYEDHQISIVVAAGNDYNKEVSQKVPATYPEVMAIASTSAEDGINNNCRLTSDIILQDTASYFTTDGKYNSVSRIGVTISAPGERLENIKKNCMVSSEGILSLKAGGGVSRMSGTSMASPHIAGAIALILEDAGVHLDPETVRNLLRTNAALKNSVPLHSTLGIYSYDGEQEGVLSVCNILGVPCP